MSKFIEVNRANGGTTIINTSQIESISVMNKDMVAKYSGLGVVNEKPNSRIYLISSYDYDPYYDVIETYEEIKAMLM